MFILDKPYVSEFLEKTLEKNKFPVLNTAAVKELVSNTGINYIDEEKAVKKLRDYKNPVLYTNSENSIEWISKNLCFTDLPDKIALCKDKIKFRKIISKIYPDFYFKEVSFEDIKRIKPQDLKFPLVLKPAVGFLSFGVYMIYNDSEWNSTISILEEDIKKFKTIYPLNVVNTSTFIIEEMVLGEEFAVDAYYNEKGEAVILNIYKHPFCSEKDVSDRVYFTSKAIIEKYLKEFEQLLQKIGNAVDLKNFPVHIELRVNKENIIPIELNPMRFAGWCMTDIAYYAWGINVYEEYLHQTKPNWQNILENSDENLYYVMFSDVSKDIKKEDIKSIDYDGLVRNIETPLEIRKIDYKIHPIYSIIFAKTPDEKEITKILNIDVYKYINVS